MTETRGFRVGLVTTLWGAIGVMVVVTAWALWPTFVEWWSVRPLIEKLKAAAIQTDPDDRRATQDKLSKLGSIAVPALIDLMKDSNRHTRYWIIDILKNMEDDAVKGAIPAVIEALQDDDLNVQLSAGNMLKHHASVAKAAIPALRERVFDRDEKEFVRMHAIQVLAKFDIFDSDRVSVLRELARSDNPAVKRIAERHLALDGFNVAPEAEGSVPAEEE